MQYLVCEEYRMPA